MDLFISFMMVKMLKNTPLYAFSVIIKQSNTISVLSSL